MREYLKDTTSNRSTETAAAETDLQTHRQGDCQFCQQDEDVQAWSSSHGHHDEVATERPEQPHMSVPWSVRGNGYNHLSAIVAAQRAHGNRPTADLHFEGYQNGDTEPLEDVNCAVTHQRSLNRVILDQEDDISDVAACPQAVKRTATLDSQTREKLCIGSTGSDLFRASPFTRQTSPTDPRKSELKEIRTMISNLLPKLEVVAVSSPSTHLQMCISSTVPLLRHLRMSLQEADLRAGDRGHRMDFGADPARSITASNQVENHGFSSEGSMLSESFGRCDHQLYDTVFSAPPEDDFSGGDEGQKKLVKTLSLSNTRADIGSSRKSFVSDGDCSYTVDSRGDKLTSTNPYYIHPEKPFRLVWDFFALSLILVMSTTIPLELTFYWSSEPPLAFEVFSGFVDCFFIADIGFNFITAFHEGHGISGRLVTHFSGMAYHYAKGWLVIDVLASFPYMHTIRILGLADSGQTSGAQSLQMVRIMKIAKVARAMKVLRVLKLNSLMQIVEEKLVAAQSMTVAFQLSKMTLVMLIISHNVACIWYAMAEFRINVEATWLSAQGLQDADGYQQYIAAFYFAITTGTTVGYGDITPENTLEQAGTSVLLILSVGYIGQFLGRVSQMVNSLRHNENLMAQSKREALLFMKQRSVPKELQFKVLRYIEHTSETQALTALDARIMERLSKSLQNELALSISGHVLKHFPLFEEMNEKFLMALCQVGRTLRFGVGEVIVAEEQPAHEMFWIVRGEVAVFRRGRHLSSLRDNDWFGELALFVPGVIRNATIRCETHCECLVLHHDDFMDAIREFADLKKEYLKLAKELRSGNMSGLKLTCAHCGSNEHLTRDCHLEVHQTSKRSSYSSY